MNNIVDITKILQGKIRKEQITEPEEIWRKGHAILSKLSVEERALVVEFLTQYIVVEVQVGLGVIKADGFVSTPIFDRIDDVYRDAASDCYFCAGTEIDPNDVKFTNDTKVCPHCQIKLNNFRQAIN